MGIPMARNLLKAGFHVNCYNRTASKMDPVIEAGATAACNPAEAASNANVVISCVTDGPDVEKIYFGIDGAIHGAKKNTLFVDMSTIAPSISIQIGERLQKKAFRFVEAPVTGGTIGAQKGTLSILVGGTESDFRELQPIFAAMGKNITYCGPWGAGQGVKLCNQIMGAMNILGVCEAFALARGLKINPALLEKALSGGAASSWALQNLAPKMVVEDWSPGFMVDTQQKDMRLILDAAEQVQAVLPGSALVTQLWRSAQARGYGTDGIHALDKILHRLGPTASE